MQSKIKKILGDLLSKYVVSVIFALSLLVFGLWLGKTFFSVSILLALSAITLPISTPALPGNTRAILTLILPISIQPSPKPITRLIAGIISIFNKNE